MSTEKRRQEDGLRALRARTAKAAWACGGTPAQKAELTRCINALHALAVRSIRTAVVEPECNVDVGNEMLGHLQAERDDR